jgi:hypothetical protein
MPPEEARCALGRGIGGETSSIPLRVRESMHWACDTRGHEPVEAIPFRVDAVVPLCHLE